MAVLDYLKRMVEDNASDLFIVAGGPVCEKLDSNRMVAIGEKVLPDATRDLITEIYTLARREMVEFERRKDDDFSFAVPREVKSRFRVNTYWQRGSMAAVVRRIPFSIPEWKDMRIPEQIMDLADETEGMILITGRAGSGKSTTQACLIDRINHTREAHIVTLEDPIEFLHQDDRSIISQREVGIDTEDYSSALRACLRQAPDVILLGEMRDQETIRTAMTAAETGHLVIATLHTNGAMSTINRIVDTFPAGQQDQIRVQLSMVLRTVISQQLLPSLTEHRVPAFEIMHMTEAISNKIRDNKIPTINADIDNPVGDKNNPNSRKKTISMYRSLKALYDNGEITAETALTYVDEIHKSLLENRSGDKIRGRRSLPLFLCN